MEKNKIVAIADVHGHYNELMSLMDKLIGEYSIDPQEYTFVFLGDYVDGGSDTSKVIAQLISWKEKYPHWIFLIGNHEHLLIDALLPHHPTYGDYYLWFKQGGEQTKESYSRDLTDYERATSNMSELLPDAHLSFILGLDTYYETDRYFFVHAGLYPMPIEEAKEKMKQYDMIWIRDEFIMSKYDWGKKIIFGHTINCNYNNKGEMYAPYPPFKVLEPIIYKNKIGLDCMRHDTGSLAALILPEEKIVMQHSLSETEVI